jgi:hypothetical protein
MPMNWYGNSLSKVWGPSVTKMLTNAYEDSLEGASRLGFDQGAPDGWLPQLIAHYVINRANNGIYDPKIISEGALDYLQQMSQAKKVGLGFDPSAARES